MADTLSKLAKPEGATTKETRKGRGVGSGLGKTAGRGQKGQYARRGRGVKRGFEGGQTPLARRLPKRGFKKHNQAVVAEINVGQGRETSVLELLDALREAGAARGLALLPPEFEPERLGEVRRSCLEVSRARDELGWVADVSLPDGLQRILASL